jgi:hypothetical protein
MNNDYIGMAQDLRRMRERIREANLSVFLSHWERLEFLDNLIEFENYCLEQPANTTGELINHLKTIIACEI